jgi:hypothetical protein
MPVPHTGAFAQRRRARMQGGAPGAAPSQLPPDFFNRVMNDTSLPHELKVQILQRAQAAMGHDPSAVSAYHQSLYGENGMSPIAGADELAHGGTWGSAFDYQGAPVGGFRFNAEGQPYDPNAPVAAPTPGPPAPTPQAGPSGPPPPAAPPPPPATPPPAGGMQNAAMPGGVGNAMGGMRGMAPAGGRMGSPTPQLSAQPGAAEPRTHASIIAGGRTPAPAGGRPNQVAQGPQAAPDEGARQSFIQWMQRQGLGRR